MFIRNYFFVFTEDFLKYSDFQQSNQLIWAVFQNFIVLNDTILIKIKNSESYHFSISKEEVGEEKFKEIITFLVTKIKRG